MIKRVAYSFWLLCLTLFLLGAYAYMMKQGRIHAKTKPSWEHIEIESTRTVPLENHMPPQKYVK